MSKLSFRLPAHRISYIYLLVALAAFYMLTGSSIFGGSRIYQEMSESVDQNELMAYHKQHKQLLNRIAKKNSTSGGGGGYKGTEITAVTAFYNWNKVNSLITTLRFNMSYVVFTSAELIRKSEAILIGLSEITSVDARQVIRERIKFLVIEFEDLPYYKSLNIIKKVMEDTRSGELEKKDPESSKYETANSSSSDALDIILGYSRFSFLAMASDLNIFGSKRFFWLDLESGNALGGGVDVSAEWLGRRVPGELFCIVMQQRILRFFSSAEYKRVARSRTSFTSAMLMGGSRTSLGSVGFEVMREWKNMLANKLVNRVDVALYLTFLRRRELFYIFDSFGIPRWDEFVTFLQAP